MKSIMIYGYIIHSIPGKYFGDNSAEPCELYNQWNNRNRKIAHASSRSRCARSYRNLYYED